jgi:hypothetical protein
MNQPEITPAPTFNPGDTVMWTEPCRTKAGKPRKDGSVVMYVGTVEKLSTFGTQGAYVEVKVASMGGKLLSGLIGITSILRPSRLTLTRAAVNPTKEG